MSWMLLSILTQLYRREVYRWMYEVGTPDPCPHCGRTMLAGRCCDGDRADGGPWPSRTSSR